MLKSLAERLVSLNSARAAFLDLVRGASAPQQAFQPAPESWSMLEVTEHLVLAEEHSLLGMLKGPPSGTRVSLLAHLRMLGVRLVLKTDFRVKVPVARVTPQGRSTLAELAQRWAESKRGLSVFLETIEEEDARAARFRHPIAGWVTAGEGLAFYVDHIGHHERQVERIQRAGGFPVHDATL